MALDRRTSITRTRKRLSIRFAPDASLNLRGFTVDVSTRGLAITTHTVLPRGTRLLLRLDLPGTREALDLEGDVAWSQRAMGRHGIPGAMGVRLTHAGAGYHAYVASLGGEKSESAATPAARPSQPPPPAAPTVTAPSPEVRPTTAADTLAKLLLRSRTSRREPRPAVSQRPEPPMPPPPSEPPLPGPALPAWANAAAPANAPLPRVGAARVPPPVIAPRMPPPASLPSEPPARPPDEITDRILRKPVPPVPRRAFGLARSAGPRVPRFTCELPVRFGRPGVLEHEGVTFNVSRTGVAFTTSTLVEEKATVRLRVALPNGQSANAAGQVVWARQHASDAGPLMLVGVRLFNSDGLYFGLIDALARR